MGNSGAPCNGKSGTPASLSATCPSMPAPYRSQLAPKSSNALVCSYMFLFRKWSQQFPNTIASFKPRDKQRDGIPRAQKERQTDCLFSPNPENHKPWIPLARVWATCLRRLLALFGRNIRSAQQRRPVAYPLQRNACKNMQKP